MRGADAMQQSLLTGARREDFSPVFVDGGKTVFLKDRRSAATFPAIIEDYVKTRYATGVEQPSKLDCKEIPIRAISDYVRSGPKWNLQRHEFSKEH